MAQLINDARRATGCSPFATLPDKSKSITTKAAELAVAVPQVVAHRVAPMAMAGPTLSVRDRKEFEWIALKLPVATVGSWP